ncbi:tocopherol cyclase family protein [Rhodococcus sp. RD6.2]|uniref:tocopherol cyclase family protein n=1 Tax=Rhodococcus sp. RD6.2 TaxID=260936 RepID=UPI000679ADE9|nr:tocopherol cyclase family protein [Rhodococcus sp. RD6.2]
MPRLVDAYRRTGADLPFGDPRRAHGVAMEGYFWRFTRPDGTVVIALCGVNRSPTGQWATLGLAGHPHGFLRTTAHPVADADSHTLGASAGGAFLGDTGSLCVDLGPDARLDVVVTDAAPWPHRMFGGSSVFHSIPALNQYWHPWLLGGTADGVAILGDRQVDLDGAQVYAEKNWGKGGFPESWWWGQAQGFDEPVACVAFAGGDVNVGPLRTEATSVVVRLPDGRVLRLCPPTSRVRTTVTDETWTLRARSARWSVDIDGSGPLRGAHVLPVPLPTEHRNVAGAIEHLGAHMTVRVRHDGREFWSGTSRLAGLEHGGLDRAQAEVLRRGGHPDAADARPVTP